MNLNILIICAGIIIVSIIIYFVKNFKEISGFIDKMRENKIATIVYKAIIIVVIFAMVYSTYRWIVEIQKSFDFLRFTKENDAINDYNDKKIIEEFKIYKSAIDENYENQNSKNPYIPEGFSYVEGQWNTGFVIQDEAGNQYVWVPCTNVEDEEVVKLERKNLSKEPFISKDICINEGCEKFILSSLENGGFYISRYEIGKENNMPVSKAGVEVFGNITRNEAQEVVNKMNKNAELHYELINGYAYDTTLSWIKSTNEIKINKIEDKENVKTGRMSYNNIYDFIDNILEITSESSYGNVIIRGFLFNEEDEKRENKFIEKLGYNIKSLDRISIREEDSYYTLENIMGFRTMLYK